jgi:uncharacterized protein
LLFHGTAGVLADSIKRDGLSCGSDGRVYLTDSYEMAQTYAMWATAAVAMVDQDAPPPVTEVGRKVASLGQHVSAVVKVRLPMDAPLGVEEGAVAPALPWQQAICDGEGYYLTEEVASWAVSGFELFRVQELFDASNREAVFTEMQRIALAFPRGGTHGAMFGASVPDEGALANAIIASSPNSGSEWHGMGHWLAVARAGLEVLEAGCEGDAAVLFAFALLHDSQRHAEGRDPDHGQRAADLARRLNDAGQDLTLDAVRLEALCAALVDHDAGRTAQDPTIAACWDADRLTLARLGVTPDPGLLSSVQARAIATDAPRLNALLAPVDFKWLVYRYRMLASSGRPAGVPVDSEREAA